MRKIAIIFLLFPAFLFAQNDSTFVDNKYLEDQIFFNLTYIRLVNTPEQISQNGFSFGLGLGVIKDLPINKRRNIGFGIGLAYGFNTYYFSVDDRENLPPEINDLLKNNKITMNNIEVPVEFRIRTSTSEKYKFWRVYPGVKFAYAFATKSSLEQRIPLENEIIEINKFQYGITLSTGYNKWNLHVYYGLDDLFNETVTNSYRINIHDLRLGLIFYIL
jgi:hypothetical protein